MLARLGWARRIVVLDSGSTKAIARVHPAVDFGVRPFDSHAAQWNHGLRACDSDWALALDADYVLSEALVSELATLQPASDMAGYELRFWQAKVGRLLRRVLVLRSQPARQRLARQQPTVAPPSGAAWPMAPLARRGA